MIRTVKIRQSNDIRDEAVFRDRIVKKGPSEEEYLRRGLKDENDQPRRDQREKGQVNLG